MRMTIRDLEVARSAVSDLAHERRHRRRPHRSRLLGGVRHPRRPTPASKATASRSPSAAATRSAPRRSTRSATSSSAARSTTSRRTSPASGGSSRPTRSCAGSGPEKGVIHLALAAIVNAVWDLYAKAERKPLWKLLADMTPRQIVSCIDFRYITDALTPDEALEHPRAAGARRRPSARRSCCATGYPAYTTSAGWMGYSDDKIRALCREALADGLDALQGEGRRRGRTTTRGASRLVREAIGPDHKLMIDANQRWDVNEAIARVRELAPLRPVVDRGADAAPTTCSGTPRSRRRCAPIGVATGEHCAEPRHLQAAAAGQRDRLLPDRQLPARRRQREPRGHPDGARSSACRSARTPAASASASTCSTCRCSTTSRVSGTMDGRVIEFVDHLHEHFEDPVVIRRGRYLAPTQPGYSITIRESVARSRIVSRAGQSWLREGHGRDAVHPDDVAIAQDRAGVPRAPGAKRHSARLRR